MDPTGNPCWARLRTSSGAWVGPKSLPICCTDNTHTESSKSVSMTRPYLMQAALEHGVVERGHQLSDALSPGRSGSGQSKLGIAFNRQMREQRAVLRHKAAAAQVEGHRVGSIGQQTPAQHDVADIGRLEVRNDAQQGGFARARRPEDGGAAARSNSQIDAGQYFEPAIVLPTACNSSAVIVQRERAARSLGLTPAQALWCVTMRLAAPSAAAGAALVALGFSNELTATLLLAPNGTRTLATSFWAYRSEIDYAAARGKKH